MARSDMAQATSQGKAKEGSAQGRTPLPVTSIASVEEVEAAQMLVDQARSGGEDMQRLNSSEGRDSLSAPRSSIEPSSPAGSVDNQTSSYKSSSPIPDSSQGGAAASSKSKSAGGIQTGQVCRYALLWSLLPVCFVY